MKGNNTLILNEATMIEAMQEYVDKRYTVDAPIVKRVTVETGKVVPGFKVELSGKEADREEGE